MPEKVEEGNEVVRGNGLNTGGHIGVQVSETALSAAATRALVYAKFEASLNARAIG